MIICYQYKLKPTLEQRQMINRWLDMLRCQYNFLLAERFRWWQYNRSYCIIPHGDYCLRWCEIGSGELKDNPNYYSQQKSLVELKKNRPWYKEVQSQVLQNCVKRVDLAFSRFLKGDVKGKKSGRPRFKNKARYRSFTFPQPKDSHIVGDSIKLSKIGIVRFNKHRELPLGFKLKTGTIIKKADGYYISLSLENKEVPNVEFDIVPNSANTLGIDLGLEKLCVDSNGNQYLPQRHLRKAESKLKRLQQKLDDNKRGMKAKRLVRQAIARLHQKIVRQRKNWHYNIAHKLFDQCSVLALEDLKIANLKRRNKPKKEGDKYIPNGQASKSGMNKSWADNGVGNFVLILEQVAQKRGARTIKVNPSGTSQYCNVCLNKVSKSLSQRWHNCPSCGCSIDRDENSALIIQKLVAGGHQDKKLPLPSW